MTPNSTPLEEKLLTVVKAMLGEMGSERALKRVTLGAALERDLGIDSLGRVELFHRLEKTFDCRLPESLLMEAQTLQDLSAGIQKASPKLKAKVKVKEVSDRLKASTVDPLKSETLVQALLDHVEADPLRPHMYLQDESGHEKTITYGQLYDRAREVASGLTQRGLKTEQTVAIMLPTSEEFFYAFFGILLAGGIPVPIYPPFRPDRLEEYIRREAVILRNAEVQFLITFDRAERLSKILKGFIPSIKAVVTVPDLQVKKGVLAPAIILPKDPAFIQYTSGSTGNPKGVLLTHENLIANLKAGAEAAKIKSTDVFVSWLPLYHDMGLIGAWFGSLYYGLPLVIMSPLAFLSRPERWLWAIHYHRGTISAAPNFAYELCIRKIADEEIEGLDLSSWRLAFNGAEAVLPKTIRRFTERFQKYGFKPQTMFPVYGLAESSVALCFPPVGREPFVDRVEREPLEIEGKAVPATSNSSHVLEIPSCGKAIPRHEIKVIDPEGNSLEERKVGALWFRGPSTMQGYYRNPEATRAVMHEDWVDTGDYAYMVDGEVFITGRKKDLIIKAGRNIYPQDAEGATAQVEGVRKGCVIAFGYHDERDGTEKMVVVAETLERDSQKRREMMDKITARVVDEVGLPPDRVVLVKPGVVPKTSSGKLQRSECKARYLSGEIEKHRLPVWLQVVRLFLHSSLQNLKSILTDLGKVAYTFYVGLLLVLLFVPLWVSLMLPSQPTAQKMARLWIRFFAKLAFWRFEVEGESHIPKKGPFIFVANHSSYIDSIFLSGVLPVGTLFVAKKELIRFSLIRTLFEQLDHMTVDRLDFSQGLQDLSAIEKRLREGKSIMIYPEGTFTPAPGIRPLKMGAFKLSVQTGIPLVLIGIKGTRSILKDKSWLMRPGRVQFKIGPPLTPKGDDWTEVIRLRNICRRILSEASGEPILDLVQAGISGVDNEV